MLQSVYQQKKTAIAVKMPDFTPSFKAISLSNTYAPVEIREQFYLSPDERRELLRKLQEGLGVREVLILSTCNRTEVYYLSEKSLTREIIGLVCIEKGIDHSENYLHYFEIFDDDHDAIRYLFEVSMGLHSHVLGDLQIISQVKEAYSLTHEAKVAEAFLHRLLHTVFHTNKRVHQETAFRDGAASVSYAAAELARELTARMECPRVLVAGLGEMGADVARSLDTKHFHLIGLANRTYEKTVAIANETGATPISLEDIPNHIDSFNVFISAVSTKKPLWTESLFAKGTKGPKIVIDLGVPRTVATGVGDFPDVELYNIDHIFDRTSKVLALREAAKTSVKAIIEEEFDAFIQWRNELQLSPTIQKIKAALDEIRKEEMARFLKNANKEETQLVEDVTQGILNKFMKLPVMTLKDACKRGDQENLIDTINDLFDLERTRKKKPKDRGQMSEKK
ncbi:glutamyl-tRNA reductase [bacterium]|nr:glutamyl-tRNA reductase [bacterium]